MDLYRKTLKGLDSRIEKAIDAIPRDARDWDSIQHLIGELRKVQEEIYTELFIQHEIDRGLGLIT
jgi:hypothetical protein